VLQTLLDDVHGQFIDAVAKGRKLPREQVVQFADGRVFSGTQALALKMVDALGGLEDAINAAAKLANLPTPPSVERPAPEVLDHRSAAQRTGAAGPRKSAPSGPAGVQDPLYLMD